MSILILHSVRAWWHHLGAGSGNRASQFWENGWKLSFQNMLLVVTSLASIFKLNWANWDMRTKTKQKGQYKFCISNGIFSFQMRFSHLMGKLPFLHCRLKDEKTWDNPHNLLWNLFWWYKVTSEYLSINFKPPDCLTSMQMRCKVAFVNRPKSGLFSISNEFFHICHYIRPKWFFSFQMEEISFYYIEIGNLTFKLSF